ncbi:MAG: RnfH family protein [Betaproteobacteria bacterium]
MKVTVVWATPSIQDIVGVDVPAGATLADAVARSGLLARYGLDPASLGFAIYGKRARGNLALVDGDRIELTRPLEVEPGVARALRARAKPLAKPIHRTKRQRAEPG